MIGYAPRCNTTMREEDKCLPGKRFGHRATEWRPLVWSVAALTQGHT